MTMMTMAITKNIFTFLNFTNLFECKFGYTTKPLKLLLLFYHYGFVPASPMRLEGADHLPVYLDGLLYHYCL